MVDPRGVALALVGAMGLVGCAPEPPESYEYVLRFPKGGPLHAGAKLMLLGEEISTVRRRPTPDGGESRAEVSFRLPWDQHLYPKASSLAVRFDTPCGLSKALDVDVQRVRRHEVADRRKGRKTILLSARLMRPREVPKAVPVRLDQAVGVGRDVHLGKTALRVGSEPAMLVGLDCAPSHDVTLQGEVVATVSSEGVVAF